MIVKQFDELHKLEYKPVVDRLVETIERTLPDSIDDCGIGCIVDFNERFDNSLIISLYVRVYSDSRKIRREFCISIHLNHFRLEDESYAEFLERELVADLANVILHIIRFIKTGVIEMEEIEGCKCLTGGLKHLI